MTEERHGHPQLAREAVANALAGERNGALTRYFESALERLDAVSPPTR